MLDTCASVGAGYASCSNSINDSLASGTLPYHWQEGSGTDLATLLTTQPSAPLFQSQNLHAQQAWAQQAFMQRLHGSNPFANLLGSAKSMVNQVADALLLPGPLGKARRARRSLRCIFDAAANTYDCAHNLDAHSVNAIITSSTQWRSMPETLSLGDAQGMHRCSLQELLPMGVLQEDQMKQIICQVACQLVHMHRIGKAHGRITAAAVEGVQSSASSSSTSWRLMHLPVADITAAEAGEYVAPELRPTFQGRRHALHNSRTDMFALGVLLLKLLMQWAPATSLPAGLATSSRLGSCTAVQLPGLAGPVPSGTGGPSVADCQRWVDSCLLRSLAQVHARRPLSPPVLNLLQQLVRADPAQRPSAAQVLVHPWLSSTVPVQPLLRHVNSVHSSMSEQGALSSGVSTAAATGAAAPGPCSPAVELCDSELSSDTMAAVRSDGSSSSTGAWTINAAWPLTRACNRNGRTAGRPPKPSRLGSSGNKKQATPSEHHTWQRESAVLQFTAGGHDLAAVGLLGLSPPYTSNHAAPIAEALGAPAAKHDVHAFACNHASTVPNQLAKASTDCQYEQRAVKGSAATQLCAPASAAQQQRHCIGAALTDGLTANNCAALLQQGVQIARLQPPQLVSNFGDSCTFNTCPGSQSRLSVGHLRQRVPSALDAQLESSSHVTHVPTFMASALSMLSAPTL